MRIVTCVAISRDGHRIVSGGDYKEGNDWKGELKVWNAQDGQEIRTLKGLPGPVTCVAVSPDGRRIVSGSGDNTLQVWDADKGAEVLALKGQPPGSPAWLSVRTANGSSAAVGTKQLKVWDAEKGVETLTLKGTQAEVSSVAWARRQTPHQRQHLAKR